MGYAYDIRVPTATHTGFLRPCIPTSLTLQLRRVSITLQKCYKVRHSCNALRMGPPYGPLEQVPYKLIWSEILGVVVTLCDIL